MEGLLVKIRKVKDQLRDAGISTSFLGKAEASAYVDHYFTMNFSDKPVAMDSFKAGEECVEMGSRKCKVFP